MFFSRCLNDVEKNYWSTKLKVVDIVWIIRKIRHMIESIEIFSIIIYIDHFVVVSISRQTTLTTFSSDKLNLRLVRASQYLFDFNLSVRHKVDKVNVMSDVLSKLQVDVIIIDKIDVFESLYEHILKFTQANLILKIFLYFHHVTLVKMLDDFKVRLKQTYQNDEHWFKILVIVRFAVVITSITSITSTTSITSAHEAIATNEATFINAVVSTIETTRKTVIVFAVDVVSSIVSISQKDSNAKTSHEKTYELSDSRDVRFRYKNDLLYYTFDFADSKRLCIVRSKNSESSKNCDSSFVKQFDHRSSNDHEENQSQSSYNSINDTFNRLKLSVEVYRTRTIE